MPISNYFLDSIENFSNPSKTVKSEILNKSSLDEKNNLSIDMEIEKPEEESIEKDISKKLVEEKGFFDPTLELSKFKMPNINLLKDVVFEHVKRNLNKRADELANIAMDSHYSPLNKTNFKNENIIESDDDESYESE